MAYIIEIKKSLCVIFLQWEDIRVCLKEEKIKASMVVFEDVFSALKTLTWM